MEISNPYRLGASTILVGRGDLAGMNRTEGFVASYLKPGTSVVRPLVVYCNTPLIRTLMPLLDGALRPCWLDRDQRQCLLAGKKGRPQR